MNFGLHQQVRKDRHDVVSIDLLALLVKRETVLDNLDGPPNLLQFCARGLHVRDLLKLSNGSFPRKSDLCRLGPISNSKFFKAEVAHFVDL